MQEPRGLAAINSGFPLCVVW